MQQLLLGTISTMQEPSIKRPVRPVLLKMPTQIAASQWGYTQIWKESMRIVSRSRPRTCSTLLHDTKVGTEPGTEPRTTQRSASASRTARRTQEYRDTKRGTTSYIHSPPGTRSCHAVTVTQDGSTWARRVRYPERHQTLRCRGVYETLGSGVAHKVPSTGDYYGIGRFTPAERGNRQSWRLV